VEYPKEVLAIVKAAAENHVTSIDAAVDASEKSIRKLPNFAVLVQVLVHRAIRDLVQDARHRLVREIKNAAGEYDAEAKVVVGTSGAVLEVGMYSLLRMPIAGTVLGELLGEELPDVADAEQSRANGLLLNARLCRRLSKIVPKKKTVKEAVKESKLNAIFKEVSEQDE
jgi:hypothetical protein